MKKKIKLLFSVLFILILCGGCGIVHGSTTRAIRHSGFALSGGEIECPNLIPNDKDGYEKIKFLNNTYAVTTEGSVYALSLGQVYSNELNCKKTDFNSKIVSIFDGNVGKADDGKFYYLVSSGEHSMLSQVTESDSNYVLYKLILGQEGVVKAITVSQENGYYYVLKDDGNVYNYVIAKENGNSAMSIVSSSIVYNKSNYGGNIIDFNYVGKAPGTYIRTASQIYRMQATNMEECSKYVDIVCKYEMFVDKGLTEHMDKILGYNGSLLITTYGKSFALSGQ